MDPAIVAVSAWLATVLLAGIVTVTVPLPLPLPGVAPSPEAVHGHAEFEDVRVMAAIPPPAGTPRLAGLMAKEQLDPNWVMEYICPPAVMEPVRAFKPVFASTLNPTEPGPGPVPDVTVIHESEVDAVQAQVAPADTLKFPVPAAAVTLPL